MSISAVIAHERLLTRVTKLYTRRGVHDVPEMVGNVAVILSRGVNIGVVDHHIGVVHIGNSSSTIFIVGGDGEDQLSTDSAVLDDKVNR
jgi:hypothetical protein